MRPLLSAILDSLQEKAAPAELEALEQFVLERRNALPGLLQMGLRCVGLLFALAGILMSPKRALVAWRGSSFGWKRDFVRFYESLVALWAFSRNGS